MLVCYFSGSYCPVFDNGIGRVIEDFSRPCSECPFKYQSADALKCITHNLKKIHFIEFVFE